MTFPAGTLYEARRKYWLFVDKDGPLPDDHTLAAGMSPCWAWKGKGTKTYGEIMVQGTTFRAHRFSYELHGGIIGESMVIDHLCMNKFCTNPEHLESVTARENTRRSHAAFAAKNHCRRGHEYTEDNVYVTPDGYRKCAICKNGYTVRRRGVVPRAK